MLKSVFVSVVLATLNVNEEFLEHAVVNVFFDFTPYSKVYVSSFGFVITYSGSDGRNTMIAYNYTRTGPNEISRRGRIGRHMWRLWDPTQRKRLFRPRAYVFLAKCGSCGRELCTFVVPI